MEVRLPYSGSKIEKPARPPCSAMKVEICVPLYSRFELFLLLCKDNTLPFHMSIRPLLTKEVGA